MFRIKLDPEASSVIAQFAFHLVAQLHITTLTLMDFQPLSPSLHLYVTSQKPD